MQAGWQAFVATLDYGYDFDRMAIDFRRGKPLAGPLTVEIAADRGWQSSGVRLEAGKSYQLDRRRPLSKLPMTVEPLALRAGRRDDRVSRRPAAGHVARRD